jgi:RimJ/RimL family protein N-acetyltransferase
MDLPAPWTPPSPLPAKVETERLVIRFWQPEDAPLMLEALDVDRASFLPWLPVFETDNRTLAECTFQIERFRRAREQTLPTPDDFVLGVFDRMTGVALGGTGLHRINLRSHSAEIGYWIRPDCRGKGLCTESVTGLISWAFAAQSMGGWGLRRIDIYCAASNAPSQRIPRKLELREEVNQPGHRWIDGIGWDGTLGWGVLHDEWDVERRRIKRFPLEARRA